MEHRLMMNAEMKTLPARRRHSPQQNHADVRRMIMQALQAPVPSRLKTWTRI